MTAPAKRQSWRTTIDDTEDSGTVVEVDARLNASTRTATWTFTALDEPTGDEPADPLQGLPAGRDQPAGRRRLRDLPREVAERRADGRRPGDRIVFDANAPIDTNVYSNAFDVAPPSSSVAALPATTTSTVVPGELERHRRRLGRGVLRRVRLGRRRRVHALADRHHRDVRDLPRRRRPPLRVLQRRHRRRGLRRGRRRAPRRPRRPSWRPSVIGPPLPGPPWSSRPSLRRSSRR